MFSYHHYIASIYLHCIYKALKCMDFHILYNQAMLRSFVGKYNNIHYKVANAYTYTQNNNMCRNTLCMYNAFSFCFNKSPLWLQRAIAHI